jgi:alcohol dehydrogenase class IV
MDLFGTIRAPRELLFGPGQRQAVGTVAAKFGRRALIVTDARLAADADLLAMVAALEERGIATAVESNTPPDVPVGAAVDAAEAARAFGPDMVVAVGGGSCLDMGKTVALLLSHGGRPQDYYGENLVPGPVLPLIAIPTTAGTGSEVTPVAVLSDPDRQLKVGISSPHLIPAAAICDPDLTLSCPPGLTAIAGADAMTHAIEAFTAARRPLTAALTQERVFIGKSAVSDHLALAALDRLWRGLEAACADGSDREARQNVMLGATLAGLAFGAAGTAAAHAIQYPIGALTHTAHGSGVACLMPYVMAFNRPAIEPELGTLADLFDGAEGPDGAIDAVAGLFGRIGIPRTLADLGLAEDRIDWVAEQSCGIARLMQNNPRSIDRPAARSLVAAAWSGDRAALN